MLAGGEDCGNHGRKEQFHAHSALSYYCHDGSVMLSLSWMKKTAVSRQSATACVGKTGVEMEAMTGSVWRFLPYMICERHWTVAWKSGRYICWKNPVAKSGHYVTDHN